jgi:poly(3-hydroxybutyrate) depolymerase
MLYFMHEFSRSAFQPMLHAAQLGEKMFALSGWPLNSLPGVKEAAAHCAVAVRLMQRYEKPQFNIQSVEVDGIARAVEESVVLDKPFGQLLRFAREGSAELPKVLLFAPLSGHYATLLRPTVQEFLRSHEVYITDWCDAKTVSVTTGDFTLDDYVLYAREFIQFLGPDVHVVAVCQPTVPVLAAIALMAEDGDAAQPKTLTLMAGPIDTRENPTKVNEFATQHSLAWFRHHVIKRVPFGYKGQGREVYPGFLQLAGFVSMNLDRHNQAYLDYGQHVGRGDKQSAEQHRRFYDEYNAVLDMPASFYLQTIDKVFLRHTLPQGQFDVAGRYVDLSAIQRTALFTVEGEKDDICGRGQTFAAQRLCSSLPKAMRRHLKVPEIGHYGVFVGSKFRNVIAPALRRFMSKHA